MEKGLTRKCEDCGGEIHIFFKVHYLGAHYVEVCDCGTTLSKDPHDFKWYNYSKAERLKNNE